MTLSKTEEDYLKALFHLNVESDQKEFIKQPMSTTFTYGL